MSILRLRDFGGLIPSMSSRSLPARNATSYSNLVPRATEFRPAPSGDTYTGVLSYSNPQTVYRMARLSGGALNTDLSGNWKAYSNFTWLARWPAADNKTERTTVVDSTAAAAPRVIDNTGADRQLGLPAPAAPAVTLNAASYYSSTERAADVEKAEADILAALDTALAHAKVGSTYTNNSTNGYLESGAQVATTPDPTRYRVYAYSGFEGTITDAYTSAAEADVAWVRTTRAGSWIQATGTPAWMGAAGTWHYAVRYHAYGAGFIFNSTTATTALTALTTVGGAALLTNAQITEIVSKVADVFDPDGPYANPVVQALRNAVTAFEAALDARPQGSYTSGATTTQINAAVTTLANSIYDALLRQAPVYIPATV